MGDDSTGTDDTRIEIKDYILREFLGGTDPSELEDSTPLITGGVLDSISTIRLVTHLEERFNVQFQAHEMSADHLDTIALITSTVQGKLS